MSMNIAGGSHGPEHSRDQGLIWNSPWPIWQDQQWGEMKAGSPSCRVCARQPSALAWLPDCKPGELVPKGSREHASMGSGRPLARPAPHVMPPCTPWDGLASHSAHVASVPVPRVPTPLTFGTQGSQGTLGLSGPPAARLPGSHSECHTKTGNQALSFPYLEGAESPGKCTLFPPLWLPQTRGLQVLPSHPWLREVTLRNTRLAGRQARDPS